jgi:hypothetical protein
MNVIYKLTIGTLYLLFGAFFAICFLAAFDGLTYQEASWSLVIMGVLAIMCCIVLEYRDYCVRNHR